MIIFDDLTKVGYNTDTCAFFYVPPEDYYINDKTIFSLYRLIFCREYNDLLKLYYSLFDKILQTEIEHYHDEHTKGRIRCELIRLIYNKLYDTDKDRINSLLAKALQQKHTPENCTAIYEFINPGITFVKEYIKKQDISNEDILAIQKQLKETIKTRGYVFNKFNRKLTNNAVPDDILYWLVQSNLDDMFNVAVYEINKLLQPYKGHAYHNDGRIYVNTSSAPLAIYREGLCDLLKTSILTYASFEIREIDTTGNN